MSERSTTAWSISPRSACETCERHPQGIKRILILRVARVIPAGVPCATRRYSTIRPLELNTYTVANDGLPSESALSAVAVCSQYRNDNQCADHADMLCRSVERDGTTRLFGHAPEVVNDRDGKRSEHAESTRPKPSVTVPDNEKRPAELHDDRRDVERDGRLEAEMSHLGDAALKVYQLREATSPEWKSKKDASGGGESPMTQKLFNGLRHCE